MERISKHVSYEEAIRSDIAKRMGISNAPTATQLVRMREIANSVFEPVRNLFNVPIFISSFFRCKRVNELAGGSSTSQHMCNNGAAMDLDAQVFGGVTNKQIFDAIKDNLEFDQLIWEFGTDIEPDWVHVSYNKNRNRKIILKSKLDIQTVKKYERLNA